MVKSRRECQLRSETSDRKQLAGSEKMDRSGGSRAI